MRYKNFCKKGIETDVTSKLSRPSFLSHFVKANYKILTSQTPYIPLVFLKKVENLSWDNTLKEKKRSWLCVNYNIYIYSYDKNLSVFLLRLDYATKMAMCSTYHRKWQSPSLNPLKKILLASLLKRTKQFSRKSINKTIGIKSF